MDRIDIESKKFLGQPKNFVSIFNAFIFDGKPVLKPQFLKNENSELVMNVSKKYADIIKRYEDGTYLDLLIIENQSTVDQAMVARVMEYEGIVRMRYIREKYDRYVPAETRTPMVFTIVLYVGERRWTAPRHLSELEIVHPGFEGLFNEYHLNLIEFNENQKYNTGEKATQDFFDLLRLVYTKQMDQENQTRVFDREAVKFVYEVTKIEALLKLLEENRGDVKVCEAWNEMMEEARTIGMNKGMEEGIEKGIEQGIKQGIEQGIEQGIATGASNKEREMYQKLIEQGKTIQDIADFFQCSTEHVLSFLH